MRRNLGIEQLVIATLLTASVSFAGSRTLTSITDGDWNDPNCWSDATGEKTTPQQEDTVVIGEHNIVMSSEERVANFHLKGGTLDLSQYDLITDGSGSWDNGIITSDDGGFVNRGNLSLSESPTKTLQGFFRNAAKVFHHDDGNLNLAYASTLENDTGAEYVIESDANITGLARYDASPTFVNRGLLHKSGGSDVTRVEVVFNNVDGRIQVDSGKLVLAGTGGAGSMSSNGTFDVASGASLDIGGGNVSEFNGVYEGDGGGTIEFNRGTIRIGTDFNETTFRFKGGGFVWRGGTFDPATAPLANEGKFVLAGDTVKNLRSGKGFRNAGEVVHSGSGQLNLEYGTRWINQQDAVYELQGDVGFSAAGGKGPKPEFVNDGSFKKTAGDGIATIRSEFVNNGLIDIEKGMINFTDQFVQQDGITRLRGGNLAASAALDVQGGIFTGTGRIFASLKSSGNVAPGSSPGIMTVHGHYTQGADGMLSIELSGVVPGKEYDRLQVNGQASIEGALNVDLLDGFVPREGQEFKFLTCKQLDGTFSEVSLPPLPGGLSWDVRYEPGAVRLVVVP